MSTDAYTDRVRLVARLYDKRADIDREIRNLERVIAEDDARIEAERTAARKAREEAREAATHVRRRTVATCGTDSGYYRHRRVGTTPCLACKQAHAEATRRRVQKKEQAA